MGGGRDVAVFDLAEYVSSIPVQLPIVLARNRIPAKADGIGPRRDEFTPGNDLVTLPTFLGATAGGVGRSA